MRATSPSFKENASRAMADAGLQKALVATRPAFPARRAASVALLPEFERLRDAGRDIKNHTLANLDFYLEDLGGQCRADRRPGALVQHRRRGPRGGARHLPAGRREDRHQGQEHDFGGARHQRAPRGERHHPGRDRSRRIHHPAPPRAAEPHHRAGLPPQPRGLGAELPGGPHRPAGRPGVRRPARHPGRGAQPAPRSNSSPPMSASPGPTS